MCLMANGYIRDASVASLALHRTVQCFNMRVCAGKERLKVWPTGSLVHCAKGSLANRLGVHDQGVRPWGVSFILIEGSRCAAALLT